MGTHWLFNSLDEACALHLPWFSGSLCSFSVPRVRSLESAVWYSATGKWYTSTVVLRDKRQIYTVSTDGRARSWIDEERGEWDKGLKEGKTLTSTFSSLLVVQEVFEHAFPPKFFTRFCYRVVKHKSTFITCEVYLTQIQDQVCNRATVPHLQPFTASHIDSPQVPWPTFACNTLTDISIFSWIDISLQETDLVTSVILNLPPMGRKSK